MKKFFMLILLLFSFLYSTDIKNNKFSINLYSGVIKIHDTNSISGFSFAYYFYDPNIYKINNKISLDIQKVATSADFYISTLKLDWIKNTSTFFAPFLGINTGYLYFKDNGYDYSAGVWGIEGGFIFEITKNFNFLVEASYQKAYEKQNIWNTPLKLLKGGVEISF